MASSLIQRFAIDTEDLATIDYSKELEHIIQQTTSDKAIQYMNDMRKEVQQAVDPVKPILSISREGLQGASLTVRPTSKLARSLESTAVEDLTKVFKKLSVSLVKYMQQQQHTYSRPGGFYRSYS